MDFYLIHCGLMTYLVSLTIGGTSFRSSSCEPITTGVWIVVSSGWLASGKLRNWKPTKFTAPYDKCILKKISLF